MMQKPNSSHAQSCMHSSENKRGSLISMLNNMIVLPLSLLRNLEGNRHNQTDRLTGGAYGHSNFTVYSSDSSDSSSEASS